jgi:hypothetical protein
MCVDYSLSIVFRMKRLLSVVDSLLFAMHYKTITSELSDPAIYIIVTLRKSYCGHIIFQDDKMIKFRTIALKPVKILKSNIQQINIMKPAYSVSR